MKLPNTPPSQRYGRTAADPGLVESQELGVGHLARRHGEFTMVAAGHMASDRDVVRFVGQDEASRRVVFHQPTRRLKNSCTAANDAVRAQLEYVAETRDWDRVRLG